jgi:hypothetical protein
MHRVVGSWTPNLPLNPGQQGRFDIVVHLPSHGGEFDDASYEVVNGPGNIYDPNSCVLDQSTWTVPFTNGHDK